MTAKCEKTSQKAAKLVEKALELDGQDETEEAYIKYLESITFITSSLIEIHKLGSHKEDSNCDASSQQLKSSFPLPERLTKKQTQKLLSVARQCLDRIDVLTDEIKEEIVVGRPANTVDIQPVGTTSISSSTDMLVSRPLGYLSATQDFPDDRKVASSLEKKSKNAGSIPTTTSLQLNLISKRNSILEAINWISPEEVPSLEDELNDLKGIASPLEKASRENEGLIASYRIRIERATTASARSNLQLELQRRIAENLDIARQKQETFATEMRRRRKRHLENAALMLRLWSDDVATKNMLQLLESTLEYEEKQGLFSQLRQKLEKLPAGPAEAKVVQTIVRKTLMDPNHPLTKDVNSSALKILQRIRSHRDYIEENNNSSTSDDVEPLEDAVVTTLGPNNDSTSADHNCTACEAVSPPKSLPSSDFDSDDKIGENSPAEFEDIYRRSVDQVRSAIADGKVTMKSLKKKKKKEKTKSKVFDNWNRAKPVRKQSLKKLKSNVEADFDPLMSLKKHFDDCIRTIHDTLERLIDSFVLVYGQTLDDEHARDECRLLVESHFYPPIYSSLCEICRRSVCSGQERRLKESMERLVDFGPVDLGYRDDNCTGSSDAARRCDEAAIVLGQLVEHTIPNEKLQLLVRVAKEICGTRNASEKGPPTKSISADDLIPLLSYACIKASKPQLVTETHLLEALTNQKNMMGEEGYCLTSLQTSLQYINSLPHSEKAASPKIVVGCLESTV